MIQRGQHLRFAREARHSIGVLREGVGQNLDSNIAVELRVGSASIKSRNTVCHDSKRASWLELPVIPAAQ
jgi:hypothetical protein